MSEHIVKRHPITTADVCIYTYGKGGEMGPHEKYVFDCTNFRDPGGQADFRHGYKNGLPYNVQKWIMEDPKVPSLAAEINFLAHLHIKSMKETWISVGLIDTHGVWISPAVGEVVANFLVEKGWKVSVVHHEL